MRLVVTLKPAVFEAEDSTYYVVLLSVFQTCSIFHPPLLVQRHTHSTVSDTDTVPYVHEVAGCGFPHGRPWLVAAPIPHVETLPIHVAASTSWASRPQDVYMCMPLNTIISYISISVYCV